VSIFDSELRACLGEVLGEAPPVPDTQAVLFFKQWLAERNLGLVRSRDRGVRVARPLARAVRTAEGTMRSSCSGRLLERCSTRPALYPAAA